MNKQDKPIVAVVGIGHVGQDLVDRFNRQWINVIAYDKDVEKILNKPKTKGMIYTSCLSDIKHADFIIVCVPTDVYESTEPDLTPLKSVSEDISEHMKEGCIVVYESTVYPGVTEDICIPILEKESGWKCGDRFSVGYSPERIMPGTTHPAMTKLIAGYNINTLICIEKLYNHIFKTKSVESIKVAEAAKIIENAQKDVNIAFMNEVAMYLDQEGIGTENVLKAMKTRPDSLNYTPGLVGGHCIGIDTYWLINAMHKARVASDLMQSARSVNEKMIEYVTQKILEHLPEKARVGFLGVTYKENVADIRNSGTLKIIDRLINVGVKVHVYDPYIKKLDNKEIVVLEKIENMVNLDCLVLAVTHNEFRDIGLKYMFNQLSTKIIIDIKGLLSKTDANMFKNLGYKYWKL